MQIKSKTRYLKLKLKTLEIETIEIENIEQWELSHVTEKSVKWGKHFGKKSDNFSEYQLHT